MEVRAESTAPPLLATEALPWTESWAKRLTSARQAQQTWQQLAPSRRMSYCRRFAALIAHRADELVRSVTAPQLSRQEILATELFPLAEGARSLARQGARELRICRVRPAGYPWWLPGPVIETRRAPWGIVLIVGPQTSPLLTPGLQMLQALAAGNAVLMKPGREGTASALALRMLFVEAGGDPALVQILSEDIEDVRAAIELGVDHVVVTGALASARAVSRQTAETLTPTTLAVASHHACFVQSEADIESAARAISQGLTLPTSADSTAFWRIYVDQRRQPDLVDALQRYAADWQPRPIPESAVLAGQQWVQDLVADGAKLAWNSAAPAGGWLPAVLLDVHLPTFRKPVETAVPVALVMTCVDEEQALELARQCPRPSLACVFGAPRLAADFARRLPAGCVTINAPATVAQWPEVSRPSARGPGVTRGPEGLRDMTRTTVLIEPSPRRRSLFDPACQSAERLQGLLNLRHGQSFRQRWQGLLQYMSGAEPPQQG